MKTVSSQHSALSGQKTAVRRHWRPAALISVCFWIFALSVHAEETRAQAVYNYDSSSIEEVGKELACLCGDCPRRPLHECICGYAQQQHERIRSMLADGQTPQAIVDAYVRDFGMEVLSKPPAEGFNLAAWIMPPAVLILGFFVVRHVLRSWSQTRDPAGQTTQHQRDDPYLNRLESELRERDL